MAEKRGDLSLLNDPMAQELLRSTIPARLAYVWRDGTPRVIPVWFHWSGQEIVLGTPLKAPKVQVISSNTKVALTIDTDKWPYKVLQIRGTTQVVTVTGVVPEYAHAAERYFGKEQGEAWLKEISQLCAHMVRISIRPQWVALLDFQQRFPSAIEAAMSR